MQGDTTTENGHRDGGRQRRQGWVSRETAADTGSNRAKATEKQAECLDSRPGSSQQRPFRQCRQRHWGGA